MADLITLTVLAFKSGTRRPYFWKSDDYSNGLRLTTQARLISEIKGVDKASSETPRRPECVQTTLALPA